MPTLFSEILFLSALFITALLALLTFQQARRNLLIEKEVAKKTQDILRTKNFLKLIMENVPDMIFVKDKNHNIIETNKAFLDFFCPEGRLQMKENGKRPFMEKDEDVIGTGSIEFYEELTDYKGDTKTILTKKVGFTDNNNEPFLLGLSRDITEKKLAQEKLQAILDNTADGLVISNQRGEIERFNTAAERMFGYEAEEVVGKNVKILMPDQYEEKHDDFMQRYLKTRQAKLIGNGIEAKGRHKEGFLFPVYIALSQAEVAHQLYFCAFFRDLTEEKKTEESQRQRQKMEDLGYLAGGVAHEINNLLQPVILLSENLKADTPKENTAFHDDLNAIIEHTDSAAKIISDILEFSRKDKIEASLLNLDKAIEAAIDFSAALLPKSLEITKTGFTNQALPIYSMLNTNDLKRVMSNILINASHATESKGKIEVVFDTTQINKKEALALGLKNSGKYGVTKITDNGIGIKEEHLPHIFTPFFTTKDIGEGTGLGLSMIYNIINGWDGTIKAESTYGKSSTFTIYLPILDDAVLQT